MNQYNIYKKQLNDEMVKIISSAISSKKILERILYALKNGKRLRPIIMIDICINSGASFESIINSAVSIELIHNASLIIDDLPCMDNDDFRRNQLSFHKKYNLHEAQIISKFMVDLAIKLIVSNFKIDTQKYHKYKIIINNICKNLGILGVAGGQLIDITPLNAHLNKRELLDTIEKKKEKKLEIEDLFQKKTCGFFEIAFLTGYLLGNDVHMENIQDVLDCAKHFGLAFQIYDDFDDIEQDKKRVECNLNDPNYINNFGLKEAYDSFHYSLGIFKTKMTKLKLFSITMEQLYDFLNINVEKKYGDFKNN